MELICPACDARYRLPEGAIGEGGRTVSCSNCGHRWHAVAQPAAVPATPEPAAAPDPAGVVTGAWSGQMHEIRQMLDEVQGGAARDRDGSVEPDMAVADLERTRVLPEPEPEPDSGSESSAALIEERDHVDPLREKLAQHGATASARAGRRRRGDDRRSLMRQHGKKVRRRKARDAAGSGAFMTGFLLLVIVAAVMVALYHLKQPIVDRFPSTASAMDKYTAAVDDLHTGVVSGYEDLRGWIAEKFADKA